VEKIIEVIPLENFKVKVKFSDNFTTEVGIKPFIRGGISDALKDKSFFQNVKIDDFNRKKSTSKDNDINKVADN